MVTRVEAHRDAAIEREFAAVVDLFRDLELPAPSGRCLAAAELPGDVRQLLEHTQGMTLALEATYGERLGLSVLKSRLTGRDTLCRHVLAKGALLAQAVEVLLPVEPRTGG